jgi:hypothetical protein
VTLPRLVPRSRPWEDEELDRYNCLLLALRAASKLGLRTKFWSTYKARRRSLDVRAATLAAARAVDLDRLPDP